MQWMAAAGTLGHNESLDSDEVRHDDGDIVVDAPLRWISPEGNLTLDKRLAAEEAELGYTDRPPPRPRRHHGQISGSPHDGPSFYTVAREEFDRYPKSRSMWRDRGRQCFGVCACLPAVPGDHRAKRSVPAAQPIQGCRGRCLGVERDAVAGA
jgi:hypothetical protein